MNRKFLKAAILALGLAGCTNLPPSPYALLGPINGTPIRLGVATGLASAAQVKVTATTGGGTISLSGGTGTATVLSGHRCVCTDTTANVSVKCAVSGTTLTATGTTTDVIAYFCF